MKKPEYEIIELTCNSLRAKLKNTIKGKISVHVEDDTLLIEIDDNGFDFTYRQSNYVNYVIKNGTEKIFNDIIRIMNKAIHNKYFKEMEP